MKNKFMTINIHGYTVEVFKMEIGKIAGKEKSWFCAYAELKGSKALSDSYLGNPTYRKEDVVGVDTAHSYNDNHTMEQKLADALRQIQIIIKTFKLATTDTYEWEMEEKEIKFEEESK